jgi:hypothetical protein
MKTKGNFVCPWCGATFAERLSKPQMYTEADVPVVRLIGDEISLEDHWAQNAVCRTNRNVSNQTQSKNQPFGAERIVLGEFTLHLVENKAKVHRDA